MVIKLDDELIDSVNSDDLTASEIEGFSNIAKAYRLNKHYVVGSIELFKLLSENKDLSTNDKNTYKSLCNNTTEIFSLKNVRRQLLIKKSHMKERQIIEAHHVFFVLSLDEVGRKNYLQETRFICESLDDCRFYYNLCKFWLKLQKHQFRNVAITTEYRHGAGNDIGKVIKNEIDKGYICFAISDSDKKCENDDCGDTYNNAENIISNEDNIFIGELKLLKVREKENLLFPQILKCTTKMKHCKDLLDDLERIYLSEVKDVYYYLDLKDGVTFEKYNECEMTKENIKMIVSKVEHNCVINEEKLNNAKEEDKVFHGISRLTDSVINEIFLEGIIDLIKYKKEMKKIHSQIPDDVIIKLETTLNEISQLPTYMSDVHMDEWNVITMQILEFGMAPIKALY